MIRLAIAGAMGRTGRRVLELATADERFEVVAALTAPGCSHASTKIDIGGREVSVVTSLNVECDVLIDFTVADGTMAWLEKCREAGIAMVIGATGHDERQLSRIREASTQISIVQAGNFSIGIGVLLDVIGPIARALGDSFDVEIVETHHRHKVDAPSGTAWSLVDEIAEATGRSRDDVLLGRQGRSAARGAGQIGVHSLRMGEIVGQHDVHFSGAGETITLRHAATSRDTFALGALRTAAWIVGRPMGYYGMRDVLRGDR